MLWTMKSLGDYVSSLLHYILLGVFKNKSSQISSMSHIYKRGGEVFKLLLQQQNALFEHNLLCIPYLQNL